MKITIERDERGPYFLLTDELHKMVVRPELSRRYDIGQKTDLLARAVGFKKNKKIKILDVTAGLCRDAYHLACLGLEVIAIEQNKQLVEVVSSYVKNFSLNHGTAEDYLKNLPEDKYPDVIYLDPMFPDLKRKTKAGKESVLLQQLALIPTNEQELNLLLAALSCATERVVVKRPLRAPKLAQTKYEEETLPLKNQVPQPNFQFKGKTIRYDIYMTSHLRR